MSDTPRSDALAREHQRIGAGPESPGVVQDWIALTQTLERELAEARAERDARRQSLAQEIDGCLKARGFHSPGPAVPADLIPAVGRALDAQSAYAGHLADLLKRTKGYISYSQYGLALHAEVEAALAKNPTMGACGSLPTSEGSFPSGGAPATSVHSQGVWFTRYEGGEWERWPAEANPAPPTEDDVSRMQPYSRPAPGCCWGGVHFHAIRFGDRVWDAVNRWRDPPKVHEIGVVVPSADGHGAVRASQSTGTLPICTSRQLPPPCEHHASGELEWPDLNGLCPVCRIGYLEAQEEMLEEWQQRAHRAEEHAAEVERPLDAQMARLNARVTALNDAEMLLRRMVSRHRNGRPPITDEDWPHIERIAIRNASPLRDAAPEPGGKP